MSASEGYDLVRRLGMGLSSAVYLAETSTGHLAIRQFVSIAELGSEEWRSEREYFLNAGRQAQALKHANIVPVLDVIDEGNEAFVAMEYESAPTLQTELARREFAPDEANSILHQVAGALDFAHAHGTIHGDLKPSDIFVSPNGQVRVSGFAISPRARQDVRRSLGGTFVHAYLSPEHLRIPPQVSARSDQYSLGVIAYRLYTGESPYGSTPDVRAAILDGTIVLPSTAQPRLRDTVDAPMLRALAGESSERFSSCSEFVTALKVSVLSHDRPKRRRLSNLMYAGIAAAALLAGFLLSHYKGWSAAQGDSTVNASDNDKARGTVSANGPDARGTVSPAAAHSTVASPSLPPSAKPDPFSKSGEKSAGGVTLSAQAKSASRRRNPLEDPAPGSPDPQPPPEERSRVVAPVSANAREFSVTVYSRNNRITDGLSFADGDPTLGELAHGDLKAVVHYDGARVPRNKLTLEWSINNHVTDRRPVAPNQSVDYENEPTPGLYQVVLKVDGNPVQTFTFRITP